MHTHYHGFAIPEHKIGVFIYIRYQPVFNLATAGTCIFQGMDNDSPLEVEHSNFVLTNPYPEFVDNAVEVNGLRVHFIEPGKKIHIQYKSKDGKVSYDIVQTAVSPLMPRGFVVPSEAMHTKTGMKPGGSEQTMHCVGKLHLNGRDFDVDCYPARDRSWRQTRTEDDVPTTPPFSWSPMCFGEDLSFNSVGVEDPNSNPIWEGVYAFPKSKPSHHYGWVVVNGEARNLTTVKRHVSEYHPTLHAATKQTIEAVDEKGQVYRFKGEAVAMANLPAWPNLFFVDSVYCWTDERGRKSYITYQEGWYAKNHRFRKGRLEGHEVPDRPKLSLS